MRQKHSNKIKTLKAWVSGLFALYALLLIPACIETSVQTYVHAKQGAYSAAISQQGDLAIIGTLKQGPLLWDIGLNQIKYSYNDERSGDIGMVDAAFSPEGEFVITAEENRVSVWSTQTGELFGDWQMPDRVRSVDISKGGRYLLAGLHDGRVLYVDLGFGQKLGVLQHQAVVESVAFSPDGLFALTGGQDKVAVLWDLESGDVARRLEHQHNVTKVEFSPSGKLVMIAEGQGTLYVRNITNGETVLQVGGQAKKGIKVSAARFSEDERFLLIGTPHRTISLWDLSTGKRIKKWRLSRKTFWKPSSAVAMAVAFMKDEPYILVASSNGLSEKFRLPRSMNYLSNSN